ncbi:hypothetical protein PF005_g256 [Phytophthora fragariae]|uniref:RxLR effector protein n=1 Tax=Phytophthora fragariae TaxID=53985 RepID=A0A6A3TP87_9STRA|nr:hypothetical protein PF003_g8339 [Phytophthora fragariae]KAE8950038.1 hypothetical protein PF009_g403 [Phytophthora fragariae]KAE9031287.1 hypothetical protein PF011_g176 [Phytophthora fragariae]KAE9140325.1 hypothetical protein PF010_g254 [Phytophthora fragariae]KAE9141043.1 hypothetical protein PF007_g363 [Phytophthora fragariae]
MNASRGSGRSCFALALLLLPVVSCASPPSRMGGLLCCARGNRRLRSQHRDGKSLTFKVT